MSDFGSHASAGTNAATNAAGHTVIAKYPDYPAPGCIIGESCCATPENCNVVTPFYRGLCTTGNICWDACNDDLHPDERSYSEKEDTKDALALMIKELRTGIRNPFGQGCPGGVLKSTCNAGERCTPPGLTLYRGMCVTTATGQGNQCLDMCDSKIPLETFKASVGKQAGTYSMAEQVRAGRDPQGYTECPGLSPWLWLWIPILLLILIGCCAAAYMMYNKMRRLKNRHPQQEPMVQDYQPDYEQQQFEQVQPQMEPMPIEEPMPVNPVVEDTVQEAPMTYGVPPLQPVTVAPTGDLFGSPNLMGGFPTTTAVAAPVTTTVLPTQYSSAPVTTAYPQYSSMAMSSQYGAAPYGAYNQVGSTSYRVG